MEQSLPNPEICSLDAIIGKIISNKLSIPVISSLEKYKKYGQSWSEVCGKICY